MLSTSLKHQFDWGNPSLIPRKINLESYKEILSIGQQKKEIPQSVQRLVDNPSLTEQQKKNILNKFLDTKDIFPFLRYFKNSFILSFSAAFISLILAILGAYSFSRVRYRGRSAIQRGILFVYMFGGIIILIPLYQVAVKLGLLSTKFSTYMTLILFYVVQTLPVSLYMLGNYFRTIPFSIEEAAMIDGCNRFETIWKIIVLFPCRRC